jgi:hypothetical protein
LRYVSPRRWSRARSSPHRFAVADYDHNNAQRLYAGAQAVWQVAAPLQDGLGTAWGRSASIEHTAALP